MTNSPSYEEERGIPYTNLSPYNKYLIDKITKSGDNSDFIFRRYPFPELPYDLPIEVGDRIKMWFDLSTDHDSSSTFEDLHGEWRTVIELISTDVPGYDYYAVRKNSNPYNPEKPSWLSYISPTNVQCVQKNEKTYFLEKKEPNLPLI